MYIIRIYAIQLYLNTLILLTHNNAVTGHDGIATCPYICTNDIVMTLSLYKLFYDLQHLCDKETAYLNP